MEPREPRNKVLIKARMQCGGQWKDVCILDYSVRGLGMTCDSAPARGTYLEIRRGPFVIVARVAWSKGHRFGARTQDPIAHVAIIGKLAPPARVTDEGRPRERRSAVRTPAAPIRAPDPARHRGRAMEFAGTVLALAAAAGLVAEAAYAQLSQPMERVRSALTAR